MLIGINSCSYDMNAISKLLDFFYFYSFWPKKEPSIITPSLIIDNFQNKKFYF